MQNLYEGKKLISCLEDFALKTTDTEKELRPLWDLAPIAMENQTAFKEKTNQYPAVERFMEIHCIGDRAMRQVSEAKKWLYQVCGPQAYHKLSSSIMQTVIEVIMFFQNLSLLAETSLTKEEIKCLVDYRDNYINGFQEYQESLYELTEKLREFEKAGEKPAITGLGKIDSKDNNNIFKQFQ